MSHDRLKHIEHTLMCAVEGQICNLEDVDAKELGCVIDMIKDLEEAIYYCTITEAMEGKSEGDFNLEIEKEERHRGRDTMYYTESMGSRMMPYYDDQDWEHGSRAYYGGNSRMYAQDNSGSSSNQNNSSSRQGSSSRGFSEPMKMRDEREGRSPHSRRMYMEAKENHQDKATQLRELEKYMQELSQDLVEMIDDATPEEKQYLEKKMSALASKIGQMK